VWSPNGRRIAFASNRVLSPANPERLVGGGHGPHELSMYTMRVNGSADLKLVAQRGEQADPTGWS
jgi:Tol biopolymer transport system component